MYQAYPSLVLGFHGCDMNVGEDLLSGAKDFKASTNEFDWLGNGMYFWENAPERAEEFANEVKSNPRMGDIKEPFVVGAILDLGRCLNLLEHKNLLFLAKHYEPFVEIRTAHGNEIPKNILGPDKLKRNLDCAVIQFLHQSVKELTPGLEFDSVRSVFIEGNDLYPGAGFKAKNHIQIAIRNPNCIKGFFRPKLRNELHKPV